ncbi:MAG: phosphatase PAP2 family protein [Pseudomonadales bacterium]|nr:phosphatase PAP2 family protein [Pseudomonadales bacterium]MDP6470333.1 phosphatase PAP2 family protein [Pseudomonadales bacterium]MDP6827239.1 phosphatase PAP2 family protein [Pseudomonadales bacterium]MDP6972458.1 phosphatase PAP2 family protein [Pseudomonadales bacterium]
MERLLAGLICIVLVSSGGCVLVPGKQPFGAHWPDLEQVGDAALGAAKDPNTWVPLVGAALLAIDDYDQQLSDWAVDHQPLFDDDASDISHDLKDATTVLWLASALAAPSEGLGQKVGGIAVGVGTLFVEGRIIEGLKDVTERDRPDDSNDRSMPSGHASMVAARTRLTRANLERIDMPTWVRRSASAGLYGIAFATSWARVEAGKHHPTDVLVGYAIGNFVASFAQMAFLEDSVKGTEISFSAVEGGGALTLRVPL